MESLFRCQYCGHFHSNFAEAYSNLYRTEFLEIYPKKCYRCKKENPLTTSIEKFTEMKIKSLEKCIESSTKKKNYMNIKKLFEYKGFLTQILEQLR